MAWYVVGLGIALLILSLVLFAGVAWLGNRGVYILSGDWGKGFGVFCRYFIVGIFVTGLGLAIFGTLAASGEF